VALAPGSPNLTAIITPKRPESRNRITKDSKKQTANALLSAYTQNVPNIVLHAQSHNTSSKKGTPGSTKLGGPNGNIIGNSNNSSPRVLRDKDVKSTLNPNVLNEIKAVYGSIDFNSTRSNNTSQQIPRSKPTTAKILGSNTNSINSSALRSPVGRNSDLTSLNSPARRPSNLNGEFDSLCQPTDTMRGTTDQQYLVEGYNGNTNISKRAKKTKSPSLLKSSLEPKFAQGHHLLAKFGNDGYHSSETMSDKTSG